MCFNIRAAVWLGAIGTSVFCSGTHGDIQASWEEDEPNFFKFSYVVTGLSDFDQRRLGLPLCGFNYCVPTASMNLLAYAANHGFPELTPGPGNWQSPNLVEEATAAIDALGDKMGTDPSDGTTLSQWYAGLAGVKDFTGSVILIEGAFPSSKFTVIGQFKKNGYKPRLYKLGETAGFSNGLIALVHGWYKSLGDCGDGKPILFRDGGHCMSMEQFKGYWKKGTPQYAGIVKVRDPGSDEGNDENAGLCPPALNPIGQSTFTTHKLTVSLQHFHELAFCLDNSLDRLTFDGDTDFRLVDGYLLVAPKSVYEFTDDLKITWLGGLQFVDSDPKPAIKVFEMPTAAQDVAVNPDLNGFAFVTPTGIMIYDPFAGDLMAVKVPTIGPKDVLYASNRSLYVLDTTDVIMIDADQSPPSETTRTAPPNPCTQMVYRPRTTPTEVLDEVILLSQEDGLILKYPWHLDAIPAMLPIPASVPLEGEVSMCLNPADGSLWLLNKASTSLYRLAEDRDGALVATAFALPAVQRPPDAFEIDDAGRVIASVGGLLHEYALAEDRNELVEVPDSPFAGMPGASILHVTHSATNFDPFVHTFPEWRNVPEVDAAPAVVSCAADLGPSDGDQVIDGGDLGLLLAAWGACAECDADLNGDDVVDGADLGVLLASWGPCGDVLIPIVADSCESAELVTEGDYAFDASLATTDGPALPVECDEGSGLAFFNDVWMLYVPHQNGVLTVSTCGQTAFDTRIAIYRGDCDTMFLVGCDDDSSECGFAAKATAPVAVGEFIRVRLGSFSGETGTGMVTVGFE